MNFFCSMIFVFTLFQAQSLIADSEGARKHVFGNERQVREEHHEPDEVCEEEKAQCLCDIRYNDWIEINGKNVCSPKCAAEGERINGVCYPSCKSGFYRVGVSCQPCNLSFNEVIEGKCLAKCPFGKVRIGEKCLQACEVGYEYVGEQCKKMCQMGEVRIESGECVKLKTCPTGQELNGQGECIQSCPMGQERVEGKCLFACNPNLERVGKLCLPLCPENYKRSEKGTCEYCVQ